MQDPTRRSHRPRWPRSARTAPFLFMLPTLFSAGRLPFLLAARCAAPECKHACARSALRHARARARTHARSARKQPTTNDATCGPPAWLTGFKLLRCAGRYRAGRECAGVHVRSPRPGGLLRPRTCDWSGHEARLGSRVGRVGRYERAAAPHMRVGPRGRALSRVQRPPQWRAARAGGADVTPT